MPKTNTECTLNCNATVILVILLLLCRSLVAYLAAANLYKKEFLLRPEIWQYVEKADYFYIAVSAYV